MGGTYQMAMKAFEGHKTECRHEKLSYDKRSKHAKLQNLELVPKSSFRFENFQLVSGQIVARCNIPMSSVLFNLQHIEHIPRARSKSRRRRKNYAVKGCKARHAQVVSSLSLSKQHHGYSHGVLAEHQYRSLKKDVSQHCV